MKYKTYSRSNFVQDFFDLTDLVCCWMDKECKAKQSEKKRDFTSILNNSRVTTIASIRSSLDREKDVISGSVLQQNQSAKASEIGENWLTFSKRFHSLCWPRFAFSLGCFFAHHCHVNFDVREKEVIRQTWSFFASLTRGNRNCGHSQNSNRIDSQSWRNVVWHPHPKS